MKKTKINHERMGKNKKNCKKWKKIMKNEKKNAKKGKSCENPIQEMSFQQLVFGNCLSRLVYFGEMSILKSAFEVMNVNHF